MNILTVDNMIEKLIELKSIHGGKALIAIRDADTSWHMKVETIRESNTHKGRILIVGEGYAEGDCI